MSIAARPFSDSRNTYIVDNDDPGAFDTRLKGTPGTHTEQRCCEDKAPVPVYTLGLLFPSQGPAMRELIRQSGRNPDELWCKECANAFEKARDTFAEGAGPFFRMVAAVVAYVPVFGTAVAYIVNSAVSIAEGQAIDDALINSIGGALPGQPASKAAYDVAVAVVRGKDWDTVALAALPVDDSTRGYIRTTVDVFKGIAAGRAVSDIGLEQLRNQLPPDAREAMDVARRVVNGENVGNIAMQEAGAIAAAAGKQQLNNFIAQSGYQAMLGTIPIELREGIQAGLLMAQARNTQDPPPRKITQIAISEAAGVTTATSYTATKLGISLTQLREIQDMAIALGKVLSAADTAFINEMSIKGALAAAANPQIAAARNLNPDGRYKWGFDIATGITEGMSLPGPGQTSWRVKLGPFSGGAGPNGTKGSNEAMQGFDVGQALQHGITKARAANEAMAIANQPPNVGAGMLLAGGIAGSGSPSDIKAGVIQQTMGDPGALAGASQVIEEKSGFFNKILKFFGLAG